MLDLTDSSIVASCQGSTNTNLASTSLSQKYFQSVVQSSRSAVLKFLTA